MKRRKEGIEELKMPLGEYLSHPSWGAQRLRKLIVKRIHKESFKPGRNDLLEVAAYLDSLRQRPDKFAISGNTKDADHGIEVSD